MDEKQGTLLSSGMKSVADNKELMVEEEEEEGAQDLINNSKKSITLFTCLLQFTVRKGDHERLANNYHA